MEHHNRSWAIRLQGKDSREMDEVIGHPDNIIFFLEL